MGELISKKNKIPGSVKAVLLFLLVFAFSKSWGQTTDLIFSEYVEGSSNNKYIEIYNGTGATVNLADYKLRLYANGASSPTNDVALSGSLATCSVVVYKNTGAALTLPGGVTSAVNAAVNYNGDDAMVLFKVSTNSIVDIIGQIGCDPGTAWTATGYSTLDKTLVRKVGVCSGITTNPGAACGVGSFPTLSTEWDIYTIDDVSHIGSHTSSCGCSASSTHTVTFNANTGTGTMAAQTASTTTNLTSNAFTKTGCTFTGWNTAANGSGTSYSDGQAYSFAADLTLYAQWSCAATNHTVTFDANTGTGTMAAQTASTTTNLTNNAFTKTGCTFAGWNTAADGSGTIYSDGQAYSFAADLTLYAQWNCVNTCPYLVAAVINGCAGSCSGEGNNEFVVMNSGSYSIPVNGTNLNLVYNNGSDQFFTQSYAAQPGIISNLNTLAGCGTLFVDASTGTIPPNSTFFVMNQGSCFNSGSFSAYCGVGTIYVAFSTDATWSSTGFFTNSNAHRYFKTDFSSINAGCGTTVYDYNGSGQFDFGSNGDGSSVTFSGTTASYVSGGGNCVPPVTILPISLIDFYGTRNGEVNELVWKVAEEENIINYIVEKSEDAIHFTPLGTVSLNHNKTGGGVKTYNLTDDLPFKGISYYRLGTTEADGSRINYKTISVDENSKEWEYSHYQQDADLIVEFKNTVPKNCTMDLFDLSGKLLASKNIDQSHMKMNMNDLANGIYFVRITTPYKTKNFKIVIQK